MKSVFFSLSALLVLSCTSANSNKEDSADSLAVNPAIDSLHTSDNVIDWPGNYKGGIPCKDCDTTMMDVTINKDNTFAVIVTRKGPNEVIEDKGEITWESNETYILLKGQKSEYAFRLGDGEITFLDDPKNVGDMPMADDYKLKKQENYPTHDKHQKIPQG
ncbi:copper resistance protein NlpE [Sphingobacterium corticis]|uniref:Copper resistance protein NlpE n=1 Tax=Sphingobacterium corticis TaxID=1812823 RepID=A0ABW5NNY7_9SPHI